MASQFYLVHHHIKPNMSEAWWGIVGGQTEEDSKEYEKSVMEKGFFNHSFMPMGPDGPMYCVWEVKTEYLLPSFKTSLTVLTELILALQP